MPGNWGGDAEKLGKFMFQVSDDSQSLAITFIGFYTLQCADLQPGAMFWPAQPEFTAIKNGGFSTKATASLPGNAYDIVFQGEFDDTGKSASGIWKMQVEGESCQGSWQASPAPVE